MDISELGARVSAHQDIFSFLCKHSVEDQSYDVSAPVFVNLSNHSPECPRTHWGNLGARARFRIEAVSSGHCQPEQQPTEPRSYFFYIKG